jgi:hypothetical protein
MNQGSRTQGRTEAHTFWPKPNGDVGMLLEDMVIALQIMDEFSHAFRHRRINATLPERALNLFCHSTPTGDSRFSVGGRELAVRDGTKVTLDKDEHATRTEDAGELA